MSRKLSHFKILLGEMFQLDQGDLDFGLYRIMKLKSDEIQKFIDDLSTFESDESYKSEYDGLQSELDDAIKQAQKVGVDVETAPIVKNVRKQIDGLRSLEDDVYNNLIVFFSKYYSEGDFISQRRRGKSTYLVPHNGEDIKLYWANRDQYYTKTTDKYPSYVFNVKSRQIRFEIVKAQNEQDNIKDDQRRFLLESIKHDGNNLTIYFEHRPLKPAEKAISKQDKINRYMERKIFTKIPTSWKNILSNIPKGENYTLLLKHLNQFTAKNTFDFFIHKDIGKFLRNELDLYLKSEILDLNDMKRSLLIVNAISKIADKIILFLTQIEEFQKSLFLKKKFILETQYCITLDRVPENLYQKILANKSQIKEWKNLNVLNSAGTISTKTLKENPYMMIDTCHFDSAFVDELLSSIDNIEDSLNGLLIHGDGFQALNLLITRYRSQIDSIYIDPPYNTDASEILYKNNYKHSSWLSIMENRLALSKELLTDSGMLCCAIDDEEMPKLRFLLNDMFDKNLGVAAVRSNPSGRKASGRLTSKHEYALFAGMEKSIPGTLPKTTEEFARYPKKDNNGRYAWENLIRGGSNSDRKDRPLMYFPIYVSKDNKLRVPRIELMRIPPISAGAGRCGNQILQA